MRDRRTGTTERVSVDSFGNEQDSQSLSSIIVRNMSISADGRYVAFLSGATNLVAGDDNRALDVFVRDRQAGATERVNVDAGGREADGAFGGSRIPSLSADGRFVAFESDASNLVAGDTNSARDVFMRDRGSGPPQPPQPATSCAEADAVLIGVRGSGDNDHPGHSLDWPGRHALSVAHELQREFGLRLYSEGVDYDGGAVDDVIGLPYPASSATNPFALPFLFNVAQQRCGLAAQVLRHRAHWCVWARQADPSRWLQPGCARDPVRARALGRRGRGQL